MMEQFRQEIVAVEVQRQSDIKAIVNELKGLMAQTEKNFLRIGKLLYEVYKNELYLQDGYKDFWDWFETQAFNFETRTARMLMRIWSYWGQGNAYRLSEAVLIEIGYTKAYMLTTLYDCGAIRSEEDLKQFIEFAKNTTTREFARLVSHHCGQQKKEEEAWITYKLRIPPDSADRLEEIVRGIAFLEGIDDEEAHRKNPQLTEALFDLCIKHTSAVILAIEFVVLVVMALGYPLSHLSPRVAQVALVLVFVATVVS